MNVANYESPQLTERLTALLASQFPHGGVRTVEDLAGFDQFHIGGLPATVRLAGLLGLDEGSAVLDVGCGLGGPARYLASASGYRVTGIDLSRSFIEAARMLTERTGLEDRVSFVAGSALELPFPAESFDGVIMQHVAMNIEDRAALYRGVFEVLKNGGKFLTYDVIERTGAPTYPAPWSSDAATSFLLTEAATRNALEAAGFIVETWQVQGVEAFGSPQPAPGGSLPPLAEILGRPNFGQAVGNVGASIADGRVGVLTAVVRKP